MSVFVLYRFFDNSGALLYIGRSINPGRRFMEHRAGKAWWSGVSRIEMAHYRSADELCLAEAVAIAREKPMHNQTAPHDPISYVTSDSEPSEGCSECSEGDGLRCGRPVVFQTGLGNYVCGTHAHYYSVVVAV